MQVGVGTSQLQADMVQQGGYQNIINTDISSVVVQHMQDLHKSIPQLQYRVGDARCGRFRMLTTGAAISRQFGRCG
jgi:4-hydroxyphenylpyruvate dioxygenase-like putative hemolysin